MSNISQEQLIALFEQRYAKIPLYGKVNWYLDLTYYNYLLPNSITSVGHLGLKGYKHPLPDSITSINGWLNVIDYNHPLPNSIKNLNNWVYLDNDYTGLPDNIYEWKIDGKIIYYI